MKKNICIVTGSRAEYGLLRNLIKEIDKSKVVNYQLICTGTHLLRKAGNTVNEILDDGFKIDASVKILSNSSLASDIETCKATSNCLNKISKEFKKLNPNIIVLLGDRFEILASAIAATILNIPIAHIHGGETTEGAIDEAFRHSITKMSFLHFVAAERYKNRVIQLGEHSSRVFNVGGMGIDAIKNIKLFSKSYLESKFSFIKDSKYLMITFHPETLDKTNQVRQLENLFAALQEFSDLKLIFTSSNVDTGGEEINNHIISFTKNNENAYFFKSLGQKLYFSLMNFSSGVVGNSSSGILEAPYFDIGTVNIGDRQKGRLMSTSVTSVKPRKAPIKKAIKIMLSQDYKGKNQINSDKYPFGNGGASKKITSILVKKLMSQKDICLKKKFYDIL